jgi:hypothetical protein
MFSPRHNHSALLCSAVARRVTFFERPKKVTKEIRPAAATPSALLAVSGGRSKVRPYTDDRRARSLARPFGLFPETAAMLDAATGGERGPFVQWTNAAERTPFREEGPGDAPGTVSLPAACRPFVQWVRGEGAQPRTRRTGRPSADHQAQQDCVAHRERSRANALQGGRAGRRTRDGFAFGETASRCKGRRKATT